MANKRIRVYELARELGLSNKEALDLCERLRIGVKSHSSSIEDPQADRVRRLADAEGLRPPTQPDAEPEPAAPRGGAWVGAVLPGVGGVGVGVVRAARVVRGAVVRGVAPGARAWGGGGGEPPPRAMGPAGPTGGASRRLHPAACPVSPSRPR